eukprot:TRINITY_DN2237_c0_g1_i1.p1 TRINITY_DN2237_c0_g1~~TRINITY_DN2237_c0_g1_i1.p1  ORF type:complete len:265 (+),score=72.87 TRINITY_DN2237_c0_g1_i1:85-879(+)
MKHSCWIAVNVHFRTRSVNSHITTATHHPFTTMARTALVLLFLVSLAYVSVASTNPRLSLLQLDRSEPLLTGDDDNDAESIVVAKIFASSLRCTGCNSCATVDKSVLDECVNVAGYFTANFSSYALAATKASPDMYGLAFYNATGCDKADAYDATEACKLDTCCPFTLNGVTFNGTTSVTAWSPLNETVSPSSSSSSSSSPSSSSSSSSSSSVEETESWYSLTLVLFFIIPVVGSAVGFFWLWPMYKRRQAPDEYRGIINDDTA